MQQRIRRVASPVLVAATVGGIIWVSAGDLNPPPGAVTPTMKTLTEVQPRIAINATNTPGDASSTFKITRSGSYYLTDNVTAAVDANGLSIEADDVTVDLSGFALVGAPGSTAGTGIYMDGRSNVEIRNGTVRGFGGDGIREANVSGRSQRVIGVRAVSNGQAGIALAGEASLVKDCAAENNGEGGITVGAGCTVTGNTANDNQLHGILTNRGCTITGNTARNNQQSGIVADPGCTVTGNTANFNGRFGIGVIGNSLVDQNTAFDNDQSGVGVANISACPTCTFGLNHAP